MITERRRCCLEMASSSAFWRCSMAHERQEKLSIRRQCSALSPVIAST
jgi:hypothetical protein